MDKMDEKLSTDGTNVKYDQSIRAALSLGKKLMNKYYALTDEADVYRIAMGTAHVLRHCLLTDHIFA